MFYGSYMAGNFVCTCADDIITRINENCGLFPTTAEIYAHSFAAQALELSRRRDRIEPLRRRKEEEMLEFCPCGRTPCRIPGIEDGYEVRFPS